MSTYTLVVTGDIEQAVLAFHERDVSATIVQAYYDEGCHKTALKIVPVTYNNIPLDGTLREQLEEWKAERGTTGQLTFYTPYYPIDGPYETAIKHG